MQTKDVIFELRNKAELSQEQQDLLKSEYNLIETKGIEFVRVKHLQSKIFEIKSKDSRRGSSS